MPGGAVPSAYSFSFTTSRNLFVYSASIVGLFSSFWHSFSTAGPVTEFQIVSCSTMENKEYSCASSSSELCRSSRLIRRALSTNRLLFSISVFINNL